MLNKLLPIGTRSVLYGYHCAALHWFFVALGWYRLHGFGAVSLKYDVPSSISDGPTVTMHRTLRLSLADPRLWLAFLLHDLGYWGKPNMDGAEGEQHPEWAATLMQRWFGAPWGDLCRYHSRFLAKRDGRDPSLLCAPDKLAIALYPRWLFLALVRATGEIREYMKQHKTAFAGAEAQRHWADEVQRFARDYAMKMKQGGADTITNSPDELNTRRAEASGVWK
jgi:hypothetical protein